MKKKVKQIITNDGSKGGMAHGDPHSAPSGGITTIIKQTGEKILIEGNEPILSDVSMSIKDKYICEGTPKGVASAVNETGGGNKFSNEGTCRLVEPSMNKSGTRIKQKIKEDKPIVKVAPKDGKIFVNSGSAIINKTGMRIKNKIRCIGNPEQIASSINQLGGHGVKFAEPAQCFVEGDKLEYEEPKMEQGGKNGAILKKAKSVNEIARHHNVSVSSILNELEMGIEVEKEHTKDKDIATTIAKHHLLEDAKYYTKLKTLNLETGGGIGEDHVLFSIDNEKADQLLHDNFKRHIDYVDIKGDSFYKMNRKQYDRFVDLAYSTSQEYEDSIYEVNEEGYDVSEKIGSMSTGGEVGKYKVGDLIRYKHWYPATFENNYKRHSAISKGIIKRMGVTSDYVVVQVTTGSMHEEIVKNVDIVELITVGSIATGGKYLSGGTIRKAKIKTPDGYVYATIKKDLDSIVITDMGAFDKKDVLQEFDVPSEHFAERGKMLNIPNRYKDIGFSYVGQKKKSTRPEKKWMVLAKKGDKYKVVHGGQKGMKDFSQHNDKKRQRRFWERMGGFDSERTKDPFSPLYWHKRFGTWEDGGSIRYNNFDEITEADESDTSKQRAIANFREQIIKDETMGVIDMYESVALNSGATVNEIEQARSDAKLSKEKKEARKERFGFENGGRNGGDIFVKDEVIWLSVDEGKPVTYEEFYKINTAKDVERPSDSYFRSIKKLKLGETFSGGLQADVKRVNPELENNPIIGQKYKSHYKHEKDSPYSAVVEAIGEYEGTVEKHYTFKVIKGETYKRGELRKEGDTFGISIGNYQSQIRDKDLIPTY